MHKHNRSRREPGDAQRRFGTLAQGLVRGASGTGSAYEPLLPTYLLGEAKKLVPAAEEARHWRRASEATGESASVPGTYRQASPETLAMVDAVERKLVKWDELKDMYNVGKTRKTRVSDGSLRKYFYGKEAAAKLAGGCGTRWRSRRWGRRTRCEHRVQPTARTCS